VSRAATTEPLAGDPLAFVLDALEAEGALADRSDERAAALLPPALAARLALPEEVSLALYPDRPGDTGAGLGSPLLDKLVGEARALLPVVSARLEVEPPRPAHVRSLAERFSLRNGLVEIRQTTAGEGRYLAASMVYSIEADERREGSFLVVVADDGAEPDASLRALFEGTMADPRLAPTRSPVTVEGAAPHLVLRAERAAREASAPALAEVARRHARDRDRIADYFDQLAAEARSPRRRTEAAAIEAKPGHILLERDRKIHDLATRYTARVTVRPAALLAVAVPSALVEIRLRRRKAERMFSLRIPACAHAADLPACEGCGLPAAKPVACDDAVHLLCELCAPSALGRPVCPACRLRR
jgi:hypothetical protein